MSNDNNFIRLYSWQRELNLTPLELLIYTTIYAFNENGQEYCGSHKYISKSFNVGKMTALRALGSLVNKGLISKHVQKGGKVNKPTIYKVVLGSTKMGLGVVPNLYGGSTKMGLGVVPNLYGGSIKMGPNNINNNITNKIINKNNNNYSSEFIELINIYENNIGMLSAIELQTLQADAEIYPIDWIKEAIKIAVLNQAKRYNYIVGILKNWKANGYTPEGRNLHGNSTRWNNGGGNTRTSKGSRGNQTVEEVEDKWARYMATKEDDK